MPDGRRRGLAVKRGTVPVDEQLKIVGRMRRSTARDRITLTDAANHNGAGGTQVSAYVQTAVRSSHSASPRAIHRDPRSHHQHARGRLDERLSGRAPHRRQPLAKIRRLFDDAGTHQLVPRAGGQQEIQLQPPRPPAGPSGQRAGIVFAPNPGGRRRRCEPPLPAPKRNACLLLGEAIVDASVLTSGRRHRRKGTDEGAPSWWHAQQ